MIKRLLKLFHNFFDFSIFLDTKYVWKISYYSVTINLPFHLLGENFLNDIGYSQYEVFIGLININIVHNPRLLVWDHELIEPF